MASTNEHIRDLAEATRDVARETRTLAERLSTDHEVARDSRIRSEATLKDINDKLARLLEADARAEAHHATTPIDAATLESAVLRVSERIAPITRRELELEEEPAASAEFGKRSFSVSLKLRYKTIKKYWLWLLGSGALGASGWGYHLYHVLTHAAEKVK